jgi:hypothetical protein
MEERFPDASCERCGTLAQLNTVPLRLVPPGHQPWQALCDDCFRAELGAEPASTQKLRPIRHTRHGRR